MAVTLSATLAANEDIERRRRAGQHVVNLAFGEAGLPVHPALREKLVAASGRNGYGPVAGAAELRDAAAGYWTRRGLITEPAQVDWVAERHGAPLLVAKGVTSIAQPE